MALRGFDKMALATTNGVPAAITEDGADYESEKYPVSEHHVVEQLTVGSRKDERGARM